MAAVTRGFVVFKDEPEDTPAQVEEKKDSQNGTTATYVLAPPPGPQLVYAPDKENINPLTGTRASADEPSGKKRKTALSVKAATASPTKRLKPLAEKATKKPASKARASADKKPKRVSSKRAVSTRVRREPSLPRVTEENDTAEQAVINSKCKDLTVLPLADISEAYDVAPAKEGAVTGEKAGPSAEVDSEAPADKASQAERPTTPPPTQAERASSPVAHSSVASVFSTPERKRIYSAFTFTSPSPAGKRLASARGSSVDRFSDAAF